LATWPQLRPDLPADGIVFVLNHQTNTHPLDRDAAPYRRPEFVTSLPFPVITTRELFDWWRLGEHAAVRAAVFGSGERAAPAAQLPTSDQPDADTPKRRRLLGRPRR